MSSTSTTGPASPPATTTSTSPSTTAPIDPRHMMSTVALPNLSPQHTSTNTNAKTAKKRSSQHLRTDRLGSRSPNSIPSSPTSVHSSSSAIFERDIEPLTPPSPHSTNPHRIPRAKGTEQLEHAVPSVLDSAASILASIDNEDGVSVVSPLVEKEFGAREWRERGEREAPMAMGFDVFGRDGHGSGFTSPIGSLRSRSPSPGRRTEGLLEALEGVSAHIVSSAGPSSGPSSPRSVKSSISAAPPSAFEPATQAQNRLSFISYADLLSSTPASLQPLSSLTTSASTSSEPPHLPAVSATLSLSSSLSPSISSPNASSSPKSPALGLSPSVGLGSRTGSRAPSVRASLKSGSGRGNDSILLVSDDVGGEWEREGLGRGLEERLEGVLVGGR